VTEEVAVNNKELIAESERLDQAWAKFDPRHLDTYLVADEQDPRINIQSIISRAFLVDSIWPEEFTALIQEEIRFGLCMNFILKTIKENSPKVTRQSILSTLENNSSDIEIPHYFRSCFEKLNNSDSQIEDYITQALIAPLSFGSSSLPESALTTFETMWYIALDDREAEKISVFEPGCGSANDYRFLDSYGAAKFLDYTGIDICQKNIDNALRRFPDIDFAVGDIMQIPAGDNTYDYSFVHDLFEHLSIPAMELALRQLSRVTRKQVCLCFFNMADVPEHIVKPTSLYHWNTLSLGKVCDTLKTVGSSDIDIVHIDTFLKENYTSPSIRQTIQNEDWKKNSLSWGA
jgi:ubiquinone/menaquinone biosynthesis C-methylase UbiE